MAIQFIIKTLRNRRVLSCMAMGATAAFIALVWSGGREAAAQSQIPAGEISAASSAVQAVLPGSSSTLVPASLVPPGLSAGGVAASGSSTTTNTAAEELQITVPASSFTPTGSSSPALAAPTSPGNETNDSASYELGWHAALAASLAGVGDTNIVRYSVSVPGVTVSPAEQGVMQGVIRLTVGGPENGGALANLGAVPYQTLMSQLQSNVEVLTGALPAGTVLGSDAFAVPVVGSSGDYGFEVDLKVTSLATLQGFVGDIVEGLGTGLTGGLSAPTEGVAINIVDSQGRRVGWWSATRAASGFAIGDPILPVAGGTETTTFPNLTGGPAPTTSVSGAAATTKAAGYALNPMRGIGPVMIGEGRAKVTRALGARRIACAHICQQTYRSPRGVLHVTFRAGKVESITSTSGQITLHGITLRSGLRRLKPLLRHWTHESCVGYIYGRGPSTSLLFGAHGSVKIEVVSTRLGGCGLP
jgi:hypothetical protein